MSLADVMKGKAAGGIVPDPAPAVLGKGEPPKGLVVTSVEQMPQDEEALANLADVTQVSPVRPARTDVAEVLFKANKLNFAFRVGESDRISFTQGYFITADEIIIKHIKENFIPVNVQVEEEGPLAQEADKK